MTGIPIPPEVAIPMIISCMEPEDRTELAVGLLACEICVSVFDPPDSEEEAGELVAQTKKDIRYWMDSYVKTARNINKGS